MADRLRIFISSRVNDPVPGRDGKPRALKEIRREIKDKLETAFDGKSIEVWVNEEEPAETDLGAVERCERWAREAHLVVAIVNGHPGAQTPRGLGICHLELKTAIDDCPHKVVIILVDADETARNFTRHSEFGTYFDGLWSAWKKFGATTRTAEEIVAKVTQAAGQAVARMAAVSTREWRRRVGVEGEAFQWASKTYSERSGLIVTSLLEALEQYGTGETRITTIGASEGQPALLEVRLADTRLVATLTGVPDSFGIPEARRYCGYPFRDDNLHCAAATSEHVMGPVHVVGVHKNVTEGQIRSHVGNPDIAIIRTPFGYFCQDRSQAIQVGYLVGVDDSSRARQRANELLEWLGEPTVLPGIRELAHRRCLMVRPPRAVESARRDRAKRKGRR